MNFTIEKRMKHSRGRAGVLQTSHGDIETPAFVVVGTKATVKALTPEQVKGVGAQAVLANTYHLYLEPGEKIVKQAGGLGKFMGWSGPTMTDSGGFQVFSLGFDFGKKVGKVGSILPPPLSKGRIKVGSSIFTTPNPSFEKEGRGKLAIVDENGVSFRSPKDGSTHRFTPERSVEIQHALGADIIFAFDECASPDAPYEYQKAAMERTHAWARRSLAAHVQANRRLTQIKERINADVRENQRRNQRPSALFGIVQGGRFEDLRKKSARFIGAMLTRQSLGEGGDFDGFGIGGSFEKKDIDTVLGWVNAILPEEKPRHLLGIGEPLDLFGAVENGCDLFDCVAPTRRARNGSLYTSRGLIAIENAKYKNDFTPIEQGCGCYTCLPREKGGASFTRAYLSHLFRAEEILANTLASIHNLYFIVNLVKKMRQAILDKNFWQFKENFFGEYQAP